MAEGTVTLPVVSQSRAPAGQVEVPAAVVAGPVREHLLHAAGTLLVVDDLSLPEPKTKQMVECLRGLGLEGASVLIVLGQVDAAIQRAARNLPHVKVLVAEGLNVYDVLGHTHLVLTRAALEAVAGRLGGSA